MKNKKTHEKKFQPLGIHNDLHPCDSNKVVHKHNSAVLPERVKLLLAFDLIPNYQLKNSTSTMYNKRSRFLKKTKMYIIKN